MATSGDTDRERAAGVRSGTATDRAGSNTGKTGSDKSGGSSGGGYSNPKGVERASSPTSGDTDRERAAGVRSGTATDRPGAKTSDKGGQGSHGQPAAGFDRYGVGSAAGMIDSGVATAKDVGRLATGNLNKAQADALRSQVKDAQDDGVGGLTGLIGLSERVDVDGILGSKTSPQRDASWRFDPAGLVGGVVGAAVGLPGLGTVTQLASNAAGNPAEINLGPNVFGSGGGAPNVAGAGRDGSDTAQLADAGAPRASTATPSTPSTAPSGGTPNARMSGLLADDDLAYLRGATPRPKPVERFNPAFYRGTLVFDPMLGRMVPASNV